MKPQVLKTNMLKELSKKFYNEEISNSISVLILSNDWILSTRIYSKFKRLPTYILEKINYECCKFGFGKFSIKLALFQPWKFDESRNAYLSCI